MHPDEAGPRVARLAVELNQVDNSIQSKDHFVSLLEDPFPPALDDLLRRWVAEEIDTGQLFAATLSSFPAASTVMKKEAILAVAVALQEFGVRQLAAYCGASPEQVEAALATVPGLVEPAGPERWRGVEPGAIRAAVRARSRWSHSTGPAEPAASAVGRAGLVGPAGGRRGDTDRMRGGEVPAAPPGNGGYCPQQRAPGAGPAHPGARTVVESSRSQDHRGRTESFTARIDAAGETARPEIALVPAAGGL